MKQASGIELLDQQSDDLIQKQGNRTSVIYVKTAIQQSQRLNRSNVDREKDISSYSIPFYSWE